jgi:hypothetical protein
MDAMTARREAGAASEEPRVGRAAALGALLGFVVVAVGVTWMTYAGSADFGGAVGVGVFVGIWGGCGFGGMMGATLCVTRAEAREAGQSATPTTALCTAFSATRAVPPRVNTHVSAPPKSLTPGTRDRTGRIGRRRAEPARR